MGISKLSGFRAVGLQGYSCKVLGLSGLRVLRALVGVGFYGSRVFEFQGFQGWGFSASHL